MMFPLRVLSNAICAAEAAEVGILEDEEGDRHYEPVIDKSVDYRAFCLQTTTKRKIKISAQWDK
jgi:hypothetical protein